MKDSSIEMSRNAPPDSLLIRRIRSAIKGVSVDRPTLRVSVAKNTNWEESPSGDQVLVRWLCWSVLDGDVEIIPAEFEVVSKQTTSEVLAKELPDIFPDLKISVDNVIDV